jgi:AcrR family transcriptional regulator
MSRRSALPRLPTPQALVEHLLGLLPLPPPARPQPDSPAAEERIIDAALAAFTRQGIRATTMSQIAKDAGISREWLYKHFRNRDAVVLAVTRREVMRFIDGLAVRAFRSDALAGALTEAFVYSVEFLRDHPVLKRVLTSEVDTLSPRLLQGAQPVVGIAVRACGSYLSVLADLEPKEATVVAETLVRIVATIIVAPTGSLDLHDPDELRRYAAVVVPAVLSGATNPTTSAMANPAPAR